MARSGSEDGKYEWGPGVAKENRAHGDDKMTCFTCHLSWTTSCGGCHLPIEANWKTKSHHFEGEETRNFAPYNPQVAPAETGSAACRGRVRPYVVISGVGGSYKKKKQKQ